MYMYSEKTDTNVQLNTVQWDMSWINNFYLLSYTFIHQYKLSKPVHNTLKYLKTST